MHSGSLWLFGLLMPVLNTAERVPSLDQLSKVEPDTRQEVTALRNPQEESSSSSFLSRHSRSDKSLHASDDRQEQDGDFQQLPSSCTGGVLRLAGKYKVTREVKFDEDCDVQGDSAELQLLRRTFFKGNVRFSGALTISSARSFLGACVTVGGNCTVDKSAKLVIEGCHNEDSTVATDSDSPKKKRAFNRKKSRRTKPNKEKGGGLNVLGALQVLGNLSFRNCHTTSVGGAAYVGGPILQQAGVLAVANCSARSLGGAFFAQDGFHLFGGSVHIYNTTAGTGGGAIFVKKHFSQSGGTLLVQKSGLLMFKVKGQANAGAGGAIAAGVYDDREPSMFNQSGGLVQIEHSWVYRGAGGGAIFTHAFYKSGGSLVFKNCSAWKGDGGAIYVKHSFNMWDGRLHAEDCTAKVHGGGLSSHGNITIWGGELSFERCATKRLGVNKFKTRNGDALQVQPGWNSGGAIRVRQSFTQSGGAVQIAGCSSTRQGGALAADNPNATVTLAGGNLSINGCAAPTGGGIYAERFKQTSGVLTLRDCFGQKGGGIYVARGVQQHSGVMSLQGCTAELFGGGIFVSSGGFHSQSWLNIQSCLVVNGNGGGLHVNEGNFSSSGPATFTDCAADHGDGGGIYVHGNLTMTGAASFKACSAAYSGGGCYVRGSVQMANGTFDRCRAVGGGGLWADGSINIASITYLGEPQPPRGSDSFVKNRKKQQMVFGFVNCPQGSGRRVSTREMGCYECPPGRTHLSANGNDPCVDCPEEATHNCTPTQLTLLPGFMAQMDDPNDLSRVYRCPNEKACPGGIIEAAESLGQLPKIVQPMCKHGFEGLGCLQCNDSTHARSDGSVLQCVECPHSSRQVALHVAFYMGKDALLFASAALSVLNVQSSKPSSGVLINQLMAFAAVSGSIMSGVMQTQSFRTMQQGAQEWLSALGMAVDMADGTSGSATMSLECIAGHFGFRKSLLHAHVLSSLTPLVLIVFLSIRRDPWLAMVVGTNVFLPGFVAFFGKYLVMLRLRPEGQFGGELRYEFLPPILHRSATEVIAAVLLAISACFALAMYGWVHAVQRGKEEPPVHVAYLMLPYKPEFAFWEVERLARKMLLMLVSSMLPSAVSPALQMEGIALVLICSLGLYAIFRPYKADAWNLAEMSLLLVALAIAGLTTCLLANDLHWAHSQSTQLVLIYLICSLAAGISIGMSVLIVLALLSERRERRNQQGV